MTQEQKISMAKTLTGNDPSATDALIGVLLTKAESAILRRMYPFGIPDLAATVPVDYEVLQCELAARYFLRRGAEGEISHDENGINRSYGSVNDEDLLSEVVSYAVIV